MRLTTYDQQNWVGLDNYRNLLHQPVLLERLPQHLHDRRHLDGSAAAAWRSGIAHLLNYKLRGRTFFRVAMLMPYATSLAAATVIFLELFATDHGMINWVLHLVHLHAVDWQGAKWPSQIAVSTIVTWRWTGYNALIYLAGMQAIDHSLYEAAAIDGASRGSSSVYVTLPGLRPTILFTIVVSTIGATQLFGEPLLYDPTGQAQRRHVQPVPDARPADVPAGLDQRPARPGLGDRLDDVRASSCSPSLVNLGARARRNRAGRAMTTLTMPCRCAPRRRRRAGRPCRRQLGDLRL